MLLAKSDAPICKVQPPVTYDEQTEGCPTGATASLFIRISYKDLLNLDKNYIWILTLNGELR